MADDNAWRQKLAEERFGAELTPGFARGTPKLKSDNGTASSVPKLPLFAMPADLPLPQSAAKLPLPVAASSSQQTLKAAPAAGRSGVPLRVLSGAVVVAAAVAVGWLARGPRHQMITFVPVRVTAARPATLLPPVSAAVPFSTPPAPERSVAVAPQAEVPRASQRKVVDRRSDDSQVSSPDGNHHRTKRSLTVRSTKRRDAAASAATSELTALRTAGPSFECRRPVSEVTRTICGDRQLAALDRRLAARFSLLDRSVDPATIQALHHGETAFLNARQSCADKACLADNYRQRLRELDSIEP